MSTCDGLNVRFSNFNNINLDQNFEHSCKDFSEVATKDLEITRKLKFALDLRKRKNGFDIDSRVRQASPSFAELVCRIKITQNCKFNL